MPKKFPLSFINRNGISHWLHITSSHWAERCLRSVAVRSTALLMLLFSLSTSNLVAQVAHNTNFGIKSRSIHSGIVADATYNATSLNLPYVDWTGWGNQTTSLGQTLYGYSSLMNNALDYAAGNYQSLEQDFSKLSNAFQVTNSTLVVFCMAGIEILDVARSANTAFRVYQVYIPVSTSYSVKVNLVGGIDNPHNKVDIFQGTTSIFHVDEFPASNRVGTYSVTLNPGNYTILVGLGAGSTYWHDAGTLSQVTAEGYFTWTVPAVVAENSASFVQTLPSIGSTGQVTVSLPSSIQEGATYPINFGTGTVSYSNFRVGTALLDSCKSPDTVLSRVSNGVWFGDMAELSSSYNASSRTAVFFVVRNEDQPWWGNM